MLSKKRRFQGIAGICIFVLSFLIYASPPITPAKTPKDLKSQLLSLHQEHRYTFLYEQAFNERGEMKTKHCANCPSVKTTIQWLPIVSHQQLAKHLTCYKEKICINKKGVAFKGLRCCLTQDPYFKLATVDLYNYVPELGLLKKELKAPPPLPARGMIARTYLYMRKTYFLPLTDEEVVRYQAWDKQYPPTPWEITRNEKISKIQGNVIAYS